MRIPKAVSWVVYQTPIRNKPGLLRAICETSEWAAMEAARPGYCTLIQAGIATEGEAEQLARGDPPETKQSLLRGLIG